MRLNNCANILNAYNNYYSEGQKPKALKDLQIRMLCLFEWAVNSLKALWIRFTNNKTNPVKPELCKEGKVLFYKNNCTPTPELLAESYFEAFKKPVVGLPLVLFSLGYACKFDKCKEPTNTQKKTAETVSS